MSCSLSRCTLLVCAAALGSAAAASSSSSHGSVSVSYSAANYNDCRNRSRSDVEDDYQLDDWTDWVHFHCDKVCPLVSPPVGLQECSMGEVHHEDPEASYIETMAWNICFLGACLVVGSIARMLLPTWIPYTVALLLLGILMGMLAFGLQQRNSCPMNALRKYDRNHDSIVQPSE